MRRGTRVGQAYVALAIDGTGINEDIADELDKVTPEAERAGKESGEAYGDGVGEGLRSRLGRIRSNLAEGLRGRNGSDFDKVGDELGARTAGHIVDALNFALSREGGDNPLSDLFDRLMKDSDGLGDRVGHDLGDRIGEALADRIEESFARMLDNLDIDRIFADRGPQPVSGNPASGGGSSSGSSGGTDSRIPDLFGRGSRNDGLNFVGSSVGNITNALEGLPGLVARVTSSFKKMGSSLFEFGKRWKDLGFTGTGGAGSMLSSGLASLGASAAAGAPAVAALAVALSLLVSVASALLAIVVALASTIASALVGALAVAGAGFLALGSAIGLVTLAFTSMTDAQSKALSQAFKPLHEMAIGLGQVMLTQMVPAFAEWSDNLQTALSLAAPLAAVMGTAFAQAGSTITAALSGPGIRMFIDMLTITLPGITTNLSSAFGQFLNGVGALFSAILPDVEKFSEVLDRVATRFADWATSASGQNAIVDFVDRALVSLGELWNFVEAVWGLISTLLFDPSGQKAGNSIFQQMTDSIVKFTAYISQEGRLERWFAQGVTMAIALGDAIKVVGELLVSLNQSGIIDGLAAIAKGAADAYAWFSGLPSVLQDLLSPLHAVADLVGWLGGLFGGLGDSAIQSANDMLVAAQISKNAANTMSSLNTLYGAPLVAGTGKPTPDIFGANGPKTPKIPSIQSLLDSGRNALANTKIGSGGSKPKAGYRNPYVAWANSLIKDGPSVAAQIRKAIRDVNTTVAKAIREASQSTDMQAVRDAIVDQQNNLRGTGKDIVENAQQALNSAASSLANAGSAKAAAKALKQVKAAQKALKTAQKEQRRLNAAAALLNSQKQTDGGRVNNLLKGLKVQNATLTDFARARSIVADRLETAKRKLEEAIQLRDNYKTQVSDSIKAFGSLATAQAQVIDGVEQALTANDITSNLQNRLDQIKHFNATLNQLIAAGLSNDALQQIVDQGVEAGTPLADALLAGGTGAIQQVNSLTGQINGIAESMGVSLSNRMHQAGIDAAKGLVDGLTSLSAQLDAAAARLGNSIAAAVKRSLGIKSPSRVLYGIMYDGVGDGAVNGLDDAAKGKVGDAADRLASRVAVSPEVAAYAASQGNSGGVSGNPTGQKFRDLIVQTPTKDPFAVAHEVLNEVTGRLP